MTRRCDWERRQRVVVDGRTVAEIRTGHACPSCLGYGYLGHAVFYACVDCGGSGTFEHCTACGQDVRRVPSGRDAQPVRCGGTEET